MLWIEVTNECYNAIRALSPSDDEFGWQQSNGSWNIPVTEEIIKDLGDTKLPNESFSDCILRALTAQSQKL